MPRFSSMDPRKLFVKTRFSYEKLPGGDSQSSSPLFSTPLIKSWRNKASSLERLRRPRLSLTRIVVLLLSLVLFASFIGTGVYRRHQWPEVEKDKPQKQRELYHWEHFERLNGYYNGIRTLVPYSDWVSEQNFIKEDSHPAAPKETPKTTAIEKEPPMQPVRYSPYPDYSSYEYLQEFSPVNPCYIDENEKIDAPDIYAYPGIPQNMTEPSFGSYKVLGMSDKVCFDRFGRYGSYGYSYSREEGGLGMSGKSESVGGDKMWATQKKIDYRGMDWGKAQEKCFEKNQIRFDKNAVTKDGKKAEPGKKIVPRHAYILRTWTGYKYSDYQILALRAMINELSLKSGGEYDVHFLLHVKDSSIPIWASDEVYQKTIEENVPKEFWGLVTLWSEQQMRMYYPEPFPNNVFNHAQQPVHSVYRSAHFALQWFSQMHPEYDFYWNWEMDIRFTGHYYEFNTAIGNWAKQQPRKGAWERSSRYYMPERHGTWQNFTDMVEEEVFQSDDKPVWGPPQFENSGMLESPPETKPPKTYMNDQYAWGVGEDADLITFNPIFDPAKTNWVFRDDVSGYNLELPEPPRRCAIITVSRLSKRLLDIMHEETFAMRHHMFPEMWPPSVAYHHGLKALYAPHPIYFDRNWPLETLDNTFNHPAKPTDSVFGWGEHNHIGSSFYYNSGFSAALWRRWLGSRENDEGGTAEEDAGTGRLCLRPILFHPIKTERGAE